MYKHHTIAAVVPAYKDERLIGRVMETMPEFMRQIVVVDDCSGEGTADKVRGCPADTDGWLHRTCHEENDGVGGSIASDYESFGCSR